MDSKPHPLAAYLDRSGRSLTDVAQAAKCSRMTLYRLMKGEQNATIDLLRRISAATHGQVPESSFIAVGPQPETAGAA